MQPTLLVTGFGPFPLMPRNPSAAAARAVAASPRWRVLGIDARALVLTTAYAAIDTELEPALAGRPDALLMIGVAGRSTRVRVEVRATARRSTLFPDASGVVATRPGAQAATRRTALPACLAVAAFRSHRVQARTSRDAGRYLCNASYHAALGCGVTVVFIHMPPWPTKPKRGRFVPARRPPAGRFADALVDVALLLLRRAVRGGRRPGAKPS